MPASMRGSMTCATPPACVLRKTGNLEAVQKILGHTDIAITSRFYTDATLEDQRQAMEQGSEIAVTPAPGVEASQATTSGVPESL